MAGVRKLVLNFAISARRPVQASIRFCAASLRKGSRKTRPSTANPSSTTRTAMSQRRGLWSLCDIVDGEREAQSSKFKTNLKDQASNPKDSQPHGMELGVFPLELVLSFKL